MCIDEFVFLPFPIVLHKDEILFTYGADVNHSYISANACVCREPGIEVHCCLLLQLRQRELFQFGQLERHQLERHWRRRRRRAGLYRLHSRQRRSPRGLLRSPAARNLLAQPGAPPTRSTWPATAARMPVVLPLQAIDAV